MVFNPDVCYLPSMESTVDLSRPSLNVRLFRQTACLDVYFLATAGGDFLSFFDRYPLRWSKKGCRSLSRRSHSNEWVLRAVLDLIDARRCPWIKVLKWDLRVILDLIRGCPCPCVKVLKWDLGTVCVLVDGRPCPRIEVFISSSNNSLELTLPLIWYKLSWLTPFPLFWRRGPCSSMSSECHRRYFLRRH